MLRDTDSLTQDEAALKIQQYWRTQRKYKQEHPFVPLKPVHGEQLQRSVKNAIQPTRSYQIPSAINDITQWLTTFLQANGTAAPAYRVQFTGKTQVFYETFSRACSSPNDTAASLEFKKILSEPYFLYEAMNLFIAGYLGEVFFLMFAEIFAIFRDQKILMVRNATDFVLDEKLWSETQVHCHKLAFVELGRPPIYFVSQLRASQFGIVKLFTFCYPPAKSDRGLSANNDDNTENVLNKHLSLTEMRLNQISPQEIVAGVQRNKRCMNIPYGNIPNNTPVNSHGSKLPLSGFLRHDLVHVRAMAFAVKQPFFPPLSNHQFLSNMVTYIQQNIANYLNAESNLTAYIYFLWDFFAINCPDMGKLPRPPYGWLGYLSQKFRLGFKVDEIILALAYFIENVAQESSIKDLNNSSAYVAIKFKLTIKELQQGLKLKNNDGLQKILYLKQNFDLSTYIDYLTIKLYCYPDETSSVVDMLNKFMAEPHESGYQNFKFFKLTPEKLQGSPAEIQQFFTNYGALSEGFVKNSMLLVYLSPKALKQYEETRKLSVALSQDGKFFIYYLTPNVQPRLFPVW